MALRVGSKSLWDGTFVSFKCSTVAVAVAILFFNGCHCWPAPRECPVDADRVSSSNVARPSATPCEIPVPEPAESVRPVAHQQPSPVDAALPEVVIDDSVPPLAVPLSDLEEIAFANNPTLAAAAARLESAIGRQIQAGLYPNPVAGYHATEIGNRGTAGQQGAFVSQRFITAGKLQLDRAIAGQTAGESHFHQYAQQQRVLTDVRIRFAESLVAQRRVQLTKELVEIGDKLAEATQRLVDARQMTENELLQAEIRAENARILHDIAAQECVAAWRRLAAVLGVPDMDMQPLAGEPDDQVSVFDWETCYAAILSSHPEVSAAQVRAERARIAVERAKKNPIPDVDVSISVRHNNITGSDNANVQVGIPLPVFDRNQGNIHSAEAEWVTATREVQRITLALQDQFAEVFRQYANARQQVQRYGETIVPKAARSLELVSQAFETGQVEYLTLLTAQQTFVEVSLAHLNAIRDLRVAAAVIDGQLLTGGLTLHNLPR